MRARLLQPGQGVASTQYLRQPYQQRHQMYTFPSNYTGGSIAHGLGQSFGRYNHQPVQQLQAQQPIPYGHIGPGYYPMQQHFARQTYDSTAGTIFRHERNYGAPPSNPGPPTIHGAIAAGLAAPAPLQTGSTLVSTHSSESSATSSTLRGPPRKPKQSGYALWCGNLPAQTNIAELKDHFSRDATDAIESVFLISKSNCAFVNYKTEESCTAALGRFHDSRFQGAKLVCRLRGVCAAPPAGTPTGPRISTASTMSKQPVGSDAGRPNQRTAEAGVEEAETTARKTEEKFFILKSLTVEDLDASVRTGSWATQSHNEAALNAAYKSAENVFLVFSANKSGEYYGYARMASAIDDTAGAAEHSSPRPIPSSTAPVDNSIIIPTPGTEHAPKGYIIDDSARGTIFWEAEPDEDIERKDSGDEATAAETTDLDVDQQNLGHPFKIEWLSAEKIPFHRARGLRNPWNQNREVKIARDGTEIEPSVGRRLANLFHANQATPPPTGPPLPYPMGNPGLPPSAYPLVPRFGRPY